MNGWRLRNRADWRALTFIALGIANALILWHVPGARPFLVPVGGYLCLAIGLVAHGHYHCPTFHGRLPNELVGLATTVFFGFPTFIWQAAHNEAHHRFQNDARDATRTWRFTDRHNALTAFTYPLWAMWYQLPAAFTFVARSWRRSRRLFWSCVAQLVFYTVGVAALAALDPIAFLWAFAVPAYLGLYAVHYFNYVQHVHCDPSSEWAHSRDWTGGVINALLFNQGHHTVHHDRPGAHWSTWPALHAAVKDRIPADHQSNNLAAWMFRQYVLAPFVPSVGTRPRVTPPDAARSAPPPASRTP